MKTLSTPPNSVAPIADHPIGAAEAPLAEHSNGNLHQRDDSPVHAAHASACVVAGGPSRRPVPAGLEEYVSPPGSQPQHFRQRVDRLPGWPRPFTPFRAERVREI